MTRLTRAAIALVLALPLAATAQEAPGWFKVPGLDTQIKFNGFAEMAYVYEFVGQTGAGEVYSNPPAILLDSDPARKQSPNSLGFGDFYSRFGFTTKTPSSAGEIGVRIEGDFNHNIQTQGNSFTHKGDFRVRHTYGTVGDWLLLGQTWTTFADLATFVDQQDENPVFNLAALRAPMVRLSLPAGPVKVTLAAEDPYFNGLGRATTDDDGNFKYEYPDFIARIDVPTPVASFSLRGVTKQFKTREPGSVSAQAFGGAVGAAVKIGGDTLVLDGEGGTGMGAYQIATVTGKIPQDAVATATDVKLYKSIGGSVGYTHVWSPQFRSNLAGSGVWIQNDEDVRLASNPVAFAQGNQRVLSGLVNTYYSFAKNAWVGAEFWYNYRKTFGGDLGHETRVILTSHFDFM